jgi:AcrR family transcriptional regulator
MSPETLTREQIVEAAVELLDDEGLEGLNMRALGKRLGSVPAAAYWHVKNKRDLITLAGEHVWSELPLTDSSSSNWRAAVTQMATDFRGMLIRHSWLLQVFGSYVVYGHQRARHDDRSLAIFQAAGFEGTKALLASMTVLTFVVGSTLGFAGKAAMRRAQRRDGKDADALIQEQIAKFSEIAKQYPNLRRLLEEREQSSGGASDDGFEFGLGTVLDGLEAQLR